MSDKTCIHLKTLALWRLKNLLKIPQIYSRAGAVFVVAAKIYIQRLNNAKWFKTNFNINAWTQLYKL